MGNFKPYIDFPIVGAVYLLIGMYLMFSLHKYERPPGFNIQTARTRLLIVLVMFFCFLSSICYVFDLSLWKVNLIILGLAVVVVLGSDIGGLGLVLLAIGAFLKEFVLGFPELVQRPPETLENESTDLRAFIGKTARTTTSLRPLGKVEMDGQSFDAEAISGDFIKTDQKVIVSDLRNTRLLVEVANNPN